MQKIRACTREVPAVQALIVFYSVRGVVAVRVLLLPVPAVGAHLLDAVLSHPAQLVFGLGGVSVALGDVAGAAGIDDVGDGLAAGFLEGMDDIQHAVTLAGAEVADEEAAVRFQLLDGADMAAGQVHDMDVVADAGAVGSGVVIAEDMDLFQLAHSHLGDVGHEVVGDAVRVLADEAGLVGADGVEVAQQSHVQGGVRLADIGEDALGHGLGGAVGVGGGTHGEVLGDRHTGGVAVDGGGGAEHEVMAVVLAHHIQDDQRAVEVVVVVFDGLGHALADGLIGCELDDRRDVGTLGEDLLHILVFGHIGLIEAEVLAGDLLDAVEDHGGCIIVVVRHDDVVAGIQELDAGVAADVACAAGNQNSHVQYLSCSKCCFAQSPCALPA